MKAVKGKPPSPGPSDDQLITSALRQLESKKPPAVAKAAQHLMKLAPGDPRLEEVLCRRLNDSCLRIRAIAASALGELKDARRAQPAAATINVTARGLTGDAIELKVCPSYNVAGLKELLAQAADTTATNLTVMVGTDILEDAWLLREHGIHEGVEISFMKCLESDAHTSASIEPLVERLDDKNEQSKMGALSALEQLAPNDKRLTGPLLHCLEREFNASASMMVVVAASKFLHRLAPEMEEFLHVLANGFWNEFGNNFQFFLRQRDPLHRLQPLTSLAEILSHIGSGEPQISEMVRYFSVYRLRVLGASPQVKAVAADVIRQLKVEEPNIRDAFSKVLSKHTNWNVLASAVRVLLRLPLEDLRMVEGLLMCKEDMTAQRVISAISQPLERNECSEEGISLADSFSQLECDTPPSATTSGYEARQPAADIPDSWESA